MRTVDPEIWYKRMQKPSMHLARTMRFGQRPTKDVEMRIRSSFCDSMKEYWLNCSVHGVRHISDRSLSKFVRYYHAAVFVVALTVGVTRLSYSLYLLRTTPPVQVNVQSFQHSIHQIPFPAVALCSTNVISKRSLTNYTIFLDSRDRNNTYDSWSIRNNLLQFGSLLTMNLPSVDVMFMQFLTQADPNFDVSRLMFQFSTSCGNMLKHCRWRGRIEPCEYLFSTRVTPLGYCCVFNSRYYSEDMYRPPKYLDTVGRDYGLSVIVHENPDDFAFVRRASIGLDVLIFDGSEYPILEGGGVRMYPVERNASVFMALSASAQYPTEEGLDGCRRRSIGGYLAGRGHAWCLAQCRWRTLAALCACRFYTIPPNLWDKHPICSLAHLTCLNKHREKLIYYFPDGYSDPALNEELQNGQVCSHCIPDCTRYVYSASVAIAQYDYSNKNKYFKNMLTNGEPLVNSTVIRLSFRSEHQKLYLIEANSRWFEIFAQLSGAWTGIIGATMISGSEVAFYCTIRWIYHYRRRSRMVSQRPKPEV